MTDVVRTRLALVITLIGGLALVTLVQNSWPGPAEQALFLVLLFAAASAAAAIVARPLLRRFARPEWLERDPWRAERNGMLFGIWLVVVAWLRMRRTLDWTGVVVLAGAVAMVELAIVMRRAP